MSRQGVNTSAAVRPANRLGLDYPAEAARIGPPIVPITDAHTHITGPRAARVYRDAAALYGVRLTYSMTPRRLAGPVHEVLGEAIRFIAVPDWRAEDKRHAFGPGFLEDIERFHADFGSRIVKFWVAPRSVDVARDEIGDAAYMRLDAPWRLRCMERASELGMIFMVHVGDPDTWFATKYADASVYGTKRQQYEPLERLLDRFTQPWIAAHMGGWPEDLAFLDGLLERHPNLYLDTSATKWMVRELSRHTRDELVNFLQRYRGRVLFGSDIVAIDDHLAPAKTMDHPVAQQAGSPEAAAELYQSRYWALRTLLETDYDGPSPIADPDLAMVEPQRFTEMDAPHLRGRALPADVLRSLYHDAAADLLEPLYERTDAAAAPVRSQ